MAKIINNSDIIIKKFGFIIDSHPKYFYIHILLLNIHNKMLGFADNFHLFSIIWKKDLEILAGFSKFASTIVHWQLERFIDIANWTLYLVAIILLLTGLSLTFLFLLAIAHTSA